MAREGKVKGLVLVNARTFCLERFTDAGWQRVRAALYWRRYQDSGEWSVEPVGPLAARARLSGWASRSDATCVRLATYIERFLQLAGGQGAKVSRVKCCSRGDRFCEYHCEWKKGLS